MKARVQPLMRKNDKGKKVEDKNCTNISLPDHQVMVRGGTERRRRNS